MNREHKYRVYSFLDKCFHYFDIYDYPSGIAGGVSEPQQYTGCHDSANKEIYEGDIVKYNNGDVIRIGYIEFMAGIFFLNFPDQTDEELGYLLVSNLKVIGNKFETPELLK